MRIDISSTSMRLACDKWHPVSSGMVFVYSRDEIPVWISYETLNGDKWKFKFVVVVSERQTISSIVSHKIRWEYICDEEGTEGTAFQPLMTIELTR